MKRIVGEGTPETIGDRVAEIGIYKPFYKGNAGLYTEALGFIKLFVSVPHFSSIVVYDSDPPLVCIY